MIDNKFNVEDEVIIHPIEWTGGIIAIFYSRRGIEYQIRYFNNGKAELEYFFEYEIEKKERSA